jgi:hypothetical protein
VPVIQYYHDKYGWNTTTFHTINWKIQYRALLSHTESDQRRILKFTHDWLPTCKRLYREGLEKSPRCPLCNHLEETTNHLLTCSRGIQEATRQKIAEYLWRDTTNHGNSELNNIIEIALSETPQNMSWEPLKNAVSPELQKSIRQQTKIGWGQLWRGRLTKEIAVFMENHYRNLNLDSKRYTGTRWCKMLIQNIWNSVLQLWKQRNEMIHGIISSAQQEKTRERLEVKVQRYYKYKEQLNVKDREKIFSRTWTRCYKKTHGSSGRGSN